MRSPGVGALLTTAPKGRHFAQLSNDARVLAEAVCAFVETGLRRGDAVVVITAAASIDALLERLSGHGIDLASCRTSGQLVVLRAEATLGRFMRDGGPDWERFRHVLGAILDGTRASGHKATRVYAEMVSILWREGQAEAAIRLEEHWNRLAQEYSFSLFCGYMMDALDDRSYAGPLHEIGRTHSDVLVTDEDELLRAAVDAASQDVLGVPLSVTLSSSGVEETAGEHRLPIGRRTVLWLHRNMPATGAKVLARVRYYYEHRA